MSDRNREDLPGLDLDRLAAWLAEVEPDLLAGPLTGRLIAGGKSNLTYEISDGRSAWIVRRPPLGHVLATAHDMSREYRVMTALAGTGVPVPATYTLCEDPDILGAPFYLMERVIGTPYRTAAELAAIGADRTRTISTGMVYALAALHAVDPAAAGAISPIPRRSARLHGRARLPRGGGLPRTDDGVR
ncbi:phosphotransferase family protein [Nocardia sp. NPDC047038]|uniref:phosphotransferase family protein n=1 Tax=Nocardia sp. NPDC047038 TaxID=3154338 RepID=UPI0033C4F3AC